LARKAEPNKDKRDRICFQTISLPLSSSSLLSLWAQRCVARPSLSSQFIVFSSLCSRRVLSPFLTLLLQLTLAFFAIMSATEATAPAAEEVKVVETPVAEPTPAAEPAAESAPVTVIVILY
jgi:hypothetical protein